MIPPAPEQVRRIVYLGTPEVAVPPLRALVDAGYEVALVVSRPDKRRGRGSSLTPSPVKAAALELGLPVTDQVDDLLEVEADIGVVVAYGRLIKSNILEALPLVNIHFSLLPRWRGAAPVERAILAGDDVTGVCLMTIEEGLDTGAVYRCEEIAIGSDDSLASLRARLVEVGTALLIRSLDEGLGEATAQEGEPTYAHKIEPDELRLRWEGPGDSVVRTVRLGGAWTTFRERRLKVLEVGTAPEPSPHLAPGELAGTTVGTGATPIDLVEVQPEGKRAVAASDWVRGARPEPHERLT